MGKLIWKTAEEKLETIIRNEIERDRYWVINIVAPLRTRFRNGERSLRLYNEIMNLHYISQPVPVNESE